MTDSMQLLRKMVEEKGQAAVARELNYSPSAVNQVLKGTYGGSLENLLQRVNEIYGRNTVQCPVMGEVALKRCAAERRKPFSVSNPQRARLHCACRECTRFRTI